MVNNLLHVNWFYIMLNWHILIPIDCFGLGAELLVLIVLICVTRVMFFYLVVLHLMFLRVRRLDAILMTVIDILVPNIIANMV